jgi:hypothetical protein
MSRTQEAVDDTHTSPAVRSGDRSPHTSEPETDDIDVVITSATDVFGSRSHLPGYSLRR